MKTTIGPQIFATLSATSIFVSAGFQFGWSSPSLPKLQDENSDLYVTASQGSWIASLMTFGCIFGPLLAVPLVDRIGRKLSLLFAAIPLLLSCILIAAAQNYWWLYMGRFVGGLGTGAAYTIGPMYLGEIADDRIRGALGGLLTTMLNVGILLTYSIGPWVGRITLPLIAAVIPVLFILTFVWVPESPYYLILRNNDEKAVKSLVWLRGTPEIKAELAEIATNVEFDKRNKGTLWELVSGRGNQKALVIIIGLLGAQQLCGIGAILAYSSLIFEASGSTFSSSISVIITGVVQLFSSLLGVSLVDRAGRRPLLMISVCFTTLFLIGEALYFQLKALDVDVTSISWLPVTAIVGVMISQPIGLGVLPYAILSEIFPCNVKAYASMVAGIWGAISGMAVTKLYQVVADAYGIHVSFWGFAGFGFIFAFFIYFVVPETKGRSLRDIQDELLGRTESTETMEKAMT